MPTVKTIKGKVDSIYILLSDTCRNFPIKEKIKWAKKARKILDEYIEELKEKEVRGE